MNTSTHRIISTANFNIFALFFMLTFFSLNFSKAQDCNWGPPTSLNIVNVGTTFASLSWQHPVQGPAPGGYEVSVIRVSNGNKVTYNVNDTAYIVNNLSPGIQYLIEISPICANGLVSPNFISKIVITVVINDLVYPICPEPPSGTVPLGNVAGPVILNANLTTLNVPWVSWIEGTNRQIYYCEVRSVANPSKYVRFLMIRDMGSDTYYFKSKENVNGLKANLQSTSFIRIRDSQQGTIVLGKVTVSYNSLQFQRLSSVDFIVSIDLYSSCSIGSTSLLNSLYNEEANNDQVLEFEPEKFNDKEELININYVQNDYIKIKVENFYFDNLEISIFDLAGKILSINKLNIRKPDDEEILYLADKNLISGIYFIVAISEKQKIIKKIIII